MKSGHLPTRFKRKELKVYSTFKGAVTEFRDSCGLDVGFKEIDKFLYVEGGKLLGIANLPASGARDEGADVTWSEDIYTSVQERERSKARFTDNAGWHIVSSSSGAPEDGRDRG